MMFRNRTESAVTDVISTSPNIPLLPGLPSRNCAIENNYSANPVVYRCLAPTNGNDFQRLCTLGGRKYSIESHKQCRRNLPGSAIRVNRKQPTSPVAMVKRELADLEQASSESHTSNSNKINPSRPLTPPRLKYSPLTSTSALPPPRPPLPKTIHYQNRSAALLKNEAFVNATRDFQSLDVVNSQPKLQSNLLTKKTLVVEASRDNFTKTVATPTEKSKLKNFKTNNIDSGESPCNADHQMMNFHIARENVSKPGEHNYTCPRCNKCTCPKCRGDTEDQSSSLATSTTYQLCGNRCLCTSDSVIEAATCLCCVRACFYHCSNYEENDICTDKPCSCRGPNWCCRWSAMAAISLVLPCLCCYPVVQGCIKGGQSCANYLKPGCRCKEAHR